MERLPQRKGDQFCNLLESKGKLKCCRCKGKKGQRLLFGGIRDSMGWRKRTRAKKKAREEIQ